MYQARGHGLRTHLEAPGKVRQFVVLGWIEGLFRDRCPDLIGRHEESRRELIGLRFFLLRAGAGVGSTQVYVKGSVDICLPPWSIKCAISCAMVKRLRCS